MPTNNFKLFDEKKANMMTDEEYAINQQRLNGVQSGVASSQLQNKTLYQTALMCYALAQLMAANGYDANDANAVSTFVNNLSLSMVQKVVDKASANDVANKVAGKWIDAKQLGELKTDVADNYLPLLGGTMLGDLILNRDPVSSLQASTKQYVDRRTFTQLFKQEKVNSTPSSSLSYIEFDVSSIDFSLYNEFEFLILSGFSYFYEFTKIGYSSNLTSISIIKDNKEYPLFSNGNNNKIGYCIVNVIKSEILNKCAVYTNINGASISSEDPFRTSLDVNGISKVKIGITPLPSYSANKFEAELIIMGK